MVYLIKVDYKDKTLLKIGYTSNLNNRKFQYKTHNPEAEFIKTREGEINLETFMHHYFSKYAYPGCPEWFYYNQEIVDKFDTLEIMIESRIVIDKLKSIMKNNLCSLQVFNDIDEEFKNDDNSKTIAYKFIKDIREFYINYIDNELEYNGLPEYLPYNPLIEFDASLFDDKKVLVSLSDIISIPHNYFRIGKVVVYNQDSQNRLTILSDKISATNKLLGAYKSTYTDNKDNGIELAKRYKKVSKMLNYEEDYVAVNRNESDNLDPVFNRLVLLAELRAFEIQKIDYSDRFFVFQSINNAINPANDIKEIDKEVKKFYKRYDEVKDNIKETLKLYCESGLSDEAKVRIYNSLPANIKSYLSLGEDKIKAVEYYPEIMNKLLRNTEINIDNKIYDIYKVGDRLVKSELKKQLQKLYDDSGIYKKAKATDIEKWFETKRVLVKNPDTNKKIDGIELIKKLL